MKLHTRDQSREGEQKAQTPVQQWEPQRKDYLQFIVDSRHVYRTFEEIIASTDMLAPFRNSGCAAERPRGVSQTCLAGRSARL